MKDQVCQSQSGQTHDGSKFISSQPARKLGEVFTKSWTRFREPGYLWEKKRKEEGERGDRETSSAALGTRANRLIECSSQVGSGHLLSDQIVPAFPADDSKQ